MNRVLITGVTGFIANHLARHLLQIGIDVRGTVRNEKRRTQILCQGMFSRTDQIFVHELTEKNDWTRTLDGCDTVYHLASLVHRTTPTSGEFQLNIAEATRHLAVQARKQGIRRFIFLGSLSVFGNDFSAEPIHEATPKKAVTPYGRAKLAAEESIKQVLGDSGTSWVIVRPPLVYGPDAPGNFHRLARLVKKLPCLPFGAATQERDLIGIQNLVDFLALCGEHPEAANQDFNVCDPTGITTKDLTSLMAQGLKKGVVQIPVPRLLMRTLLIAVGQRETYEKLFETYRVDSSKAMQTLQWNPRSDVQEMIQESFLPQDDWP